MRSERMVFIGSDGKRRVYRYIHLSLMDKFFGKVRQR